MTRLVIFDLDGTLLDTVQDLGDATNYALRMCGFPERPLGDYYQLVGRGIYNLFRSAMPSPEATAGAQVSAPAASAAPATPAAPAAPATPAAPVAPAVAGTTVSASASSASPEGATDSLREAMVEKMASYFLPYYDAHMCDYTRPYDGIPELLRSLAAAGIQVALASNKYQEGAEKLISHFFPDIPFFKILGQREGLPIKPDPQVVFQIMGAAASPGSSSATSTSDVPTSEPASPSPDPGSQHFSPDEVTYVGDSNVDMQTGLNAGVKTIGVTWGFRDRTELEAYHPFAVVDTIDELKDLLLN